MIASILKIMTKLISILPDDPLLSAIESRMEVISSYMGYMNYFIPFNGVANLLDLWVKAIMLYWIFYINRDLIKKWFDKIVDFVMSKFQIGGGSSD